MQLPVTYRRGIPFFYPKTEVEFQKDIYERYDDMVRRQSALHLADQLWGHYPMQAVLDFASQHYPSATVQNIVEVGCGLGRWIASLAQRYPQASCWGIDYSYQMLRRANEFWVRGETITIDLAHKGFASPLQVRGAQLSNLQWGLAKATHLPFDDETQDILISSFLLDRLSDPVQGIAEMYRVLRSKAKLILVSPLNFDQAEHWEKLHPPTKLRQQLTEQGFEILLWEEALRIEEPLDLRGNKLHWNCIGFVARKIT